MSLTVREFNILYKLLSYPKKTFTRSQFMDEFWDMEMSSFWHKKSFFRKHFFFFRVIIGFICGFSSLPTFMGQFKKKYGISPGQYRKKSKRLL